MTPSKEKAKELLFMFSHEVRGIFFKKFRLKRCALIAVDEMENVLTNYGKLTGELQNMDSEFRYLEELRTEIRNL